MSTTRRTDDSTNQAIGINSSPVSVHHRSAGGGYHTVCWDSGSSCVCHTRPPEPTPPCSDRCVYRIGKKPTEGPEALPAPGELESGAARRLQSNKQRTHTLLQILERPGAASGRDGSSEHLADLVVEEAVPVDGDFPELLALLRDCSCRHRVASRDFKTRVLHCSNVKLAKILVAVADGARVVFHEVSAFQNTQAGRKKRGVHRHAHSLETRHWNEIEILSGKGVQVGVESVAHTDIYLG